MFNNVPSSIKIGLQFLPDRDCQSIEGTGVLKIQVKESRHLETLMPDKAILRVWVHCSMYPNFKSISTTQMTKNPGFSSNPSWEHTFTYVNQTLRDLLENCAVEVSLSDGNENIGYVCFSSYPCRPKNFHKWKVSTDSEASHWEQMLSHPGEVVVRWHPLDKCLQSRKVDYYKEPPLFWNPYGDEFQQVVCWEI